METMDKLRDLKIDLFIHSFVHSYFNSSLLLYQALVRDIRQKNE